MRKSHLNDSNHRHRAFGLLASLVVIAGVATPGRAAVLTDPTLVFGSDAIDPAGAQTISFEAIHSTSEATLEASSMFGAVQTFTGFQTVGVVGATGNTIDFTDPLRADARFVVTGDHSTNGNSGHEASTNSVATSPSSYVQLNGNGNVEPGSLALTLTFGSYDDNALTFTPHDQLTWAAGFAVTNIVQANTITVEFFNAAGGLLSTQSADGINSGTQGQEVYFGYAVDRLDLANYIGSIVITRSWTDGSFAGTSIGVDDIGWMSVPEPTSAALLGLASLILMKGSCRLRRDVARR